MQIHTNGRRNAVPWRRGALALALAVPAAVAAAAAPAQAVPVPEGGAPTATRPCLARDFKIIENSREGAAGTTHIEFALIRITGGPDDPDNPTHQPCLLKREHKVQWVNDDEEPVGAEATFEGDPGDPFLIPVEGTARLNLAQPNAGNYDPEVCEPTDVRGIQVWFADGATVAPTGGQDTVCANSEVAIPRYSVAEAPD
ncbi:hypothetical protein ACFO4E_24970 [Nocardiopsis mangrovi]|uniref:Secreted protein n=1 Tax=Nocardiopsis mangrovi TaxID=1179818 RepID=A0ABV9E339_9ACTN